MMEIFTGVSSLAPKSRDTLTFWLSVWLSSDSNIVNSVTQLTYFSVHSWL